MFVTGGGCGRWLDQVLRESVCWAKELELHPEAKGGGQFPPWLRWRSNVHAQSLVLEKLSQSSQLEPSGRPHSCLLSEAGSGIEQEPGTSARRLLQQSRAEAVSGNPEQSPAWASLPFFLLFLPPSFLPRSPTFIYVFLQYLISADHVPGTVKVAREIIVNKTGKNPCLCQTNPSGGNHRGRGWGRDK